jgi:hypothetical protein
VTQPAQQIEASDGSDGLVDETSGVEVRHSYIRPKHPGVPGADAVPSFLIRQTEDQFVLPRLLVWSTLGLLAYGTASAGASTYHFMRDARVTPMAAAHIRAELHALLDEAARRQPAQLPRAPLRESLQERTQDNVHEHVSEAQALAFVPYTHVAHIKANATLYDCRVFSMFACQPVGRVVELLPGEVAETNTAGIAARGQYALMQLTDPSAVEAESLSVRDPLGFELSTSVPSTPTLDSDTGTAAAETLL